MPRQKSKIVSLKDAEKTLGEASNGLNTDEVATLLKVKGYIGLDGDLKEAGNIIAEDRLAKMKTGERILIEKYILEQHNIDITLDYTKD